MSLFFLQQGQEWSRENHGKRTNGLHSKQDGHNINLGSMAIADIAVERPTTPGKRLLAERDQSHNPIEHRSHQPSQHRVDAWRNDVIADGRGERTTYASLDSPRGKKISGAVGHLQQSEFGFIPSGGDEQLIHGRKHVTPAAKSPSRFGKKVFDGNNRESKKQVFRHSEQAPDHDLMQEECQLARKSRVGGEHTHAINQRNVIVDFKEDTFCYYSGKDGGRTGLSNLVVQPARASKKSVAHKNPRQDETFFHEYSSRRPATARSDRNILTGNSISDPPEKARGKHHVREWVTSSQRDVITGHINDSRARQSRPLSGKSAMQRGSQISF